MMCAMNGPCCILGILSVHAEVAEQADATVSKTVEGKPHVGSSPTFGTIAIHHGYLEGRA